MGQDDIIREIVKRGKVMQKDLSDKFGYQGPFSQQLAQLRKKRLAIREKIPQPRGRALWMYYPTPEAIEQYGERREQ